MPIDINLLAEIQAKMALLTLLRGTESKLKDFPCDLILWGNQAAWAFPEPLYCQFVRTAYRGDCATHKNLRMGREEREQILKENRSMLSDAAYNPELFNR